MIALQIKHTAPSRTHPSIERLDIRSGEIIFRQGDVGDCLYIIIDGIVRVFMDTGVVDAKKGRYQQLLGTSVDKEILFPWLPCPRLRLKNAKNK